MREFVKHNLARYKVPRDVHFIDELPRNPTGKVLKRQLRERYATRLSSISRTQASVKVISGFSPILALSRERRMFMKFLRTVSNPAPAGHDRRTCGRRRRRHRDRRRRFGLRAGSGPEAARPGRPRRAGGQAHQRPHRRHQVHQPSDRRLEHPGIGPDPVRSHRAAVALQRPSPAARAAVRPRRRAGRRQQRLLLGL